MGLGFCSWVFAVGGFVVFYWVVDMTKQPEALKLADILEFKIPSISCLEDAAIELRRLHEENVELLGLLTSLVNGSLTVSELSL